MTWRRNEQGMTLIELLVAMTVFSIISIFFLRVAVSGNDATRATRQVASVSAEARLGLNRMLRDTREARRIEAATPTSYTIHVDFDQDDNPSETLNAQGDAEVETFSVVGGRLLLNGEVLIDGVSQIGSRPIFSYTSSLLDYDWNKDGVTTLAELQEAPTRGFTTLGNVELLLNSVHYSMRITDGAASSNFILEAQLRNQR